MGSSTTLCRIGEFDASRLDGKGTREVEPPKSNWALAIDTPPFSAYRVTGGITYTFGGLKVNTRAQVLDTGWTGRFPVSTLPVKSSAGSSISTACERRD